MSEQYTPTTDDVRLEYMAVRWGKNDTVSFEARAEFDRWLAEHDRQVAEKTLLDVADDVDARWDETGLGAVGASWIRARAEAYRKEQG